jgi:hypothetical protein
MPLTQPSWRTLQLGLSCSLGLKSKTCDDVLPVTDVEVYHLTRLAAYSSRSLSMLESIRSLVSAIRNDSAPAAACPRVYRLH